MILTNVQHFKAVTIPSILILIWLPLIIFYNGKTSYKFLGRRESNSQHLGHEPNLWAITTYPFLANDTLSISIIYMKEINWALTGLGIKLLIWKILGNFVFVGVHKLALNYSSKISLGQRKWPLLCYQRQRTGKYLFGKGYFCHSYTISILKNPFE